MAADKHNKLRNMVYVSSSVDPKTKISIGFIYDKMTKGMSEQNKPLLIVGTGIGDIADARGDILKQIESKPKIKLLVETIMKNDSKILNKLTLEPASDDLLRQNATDTIVSSIATMANQGFGVAIPKLNIAFVPFKDNKLVKPVSAHELGHLTGSAMARNVLGVIPMIPMSLGLGAALAGAMKHPKLAKIGGIATLATLPLVMGPLLEERRATARAKDVLDTDEEKKILDRAGQSYVTVTLLTGLLAGLSGLSATFSKTLASGGAKKWRRIR